MHAIAQAHRDASLDLFRALISLDQQVACGQDSRSSRVAQALRQTAQINHRQLDPAHIDTPEQYRVLVHPDTSFLEEIIPPYSSSARIFSLTMLPVNLYTLSVTP